jgi:hypothetical protein
MRKLFLVFMLPYILSAAEEKIISVPYTEEVPVIDGRIAEECWNTAEAREDFIRPGTSDGIKERTSIKMLFNKHGIYVAFQRHLSEPESYEKAVDAMHLKHPAGYCLRMKNFHGRYRVELFFDENASGVDSNTWQILLNSLNQYSGHRGGNWDIFNVPVKTAARLEKGVWCMEMFFGFEGLSIGDTWGFNFCVEEILPVTAWCNTDGPYFNPR